MGDKAFLDSLAQVLYIEISQKLNSWGDRPSFVPPVWRGHPISVEQLEKPVYRWPVPDDSWPKSLRETPEPMRRLLLLRRLEELGYIHFDEEEGNIYHPLARHY